jgi:hypothetical protein
MTRAELVKGSATFIAVIVAGSLSVHFVDRQFALAEADKAQDSAAESPTSSVACVGADGSWKNWVWANVPTLSPKCATGR